MRYAARICALCMLFLGCATTATQGPEKAPDLSDHRSPAEKSSQSIPESAKQPELPAEAAQQPEIPAEPAQTITPSADPTKTAEPTAESPLTPPKMLLPAESTKRQPPKTCTYKTYQWSTVKRKSVNRRKVQKKYTELSAEEKAPDYEYSGCTVCEEDQVAVSVEGLPTIEVCWFYAPKVRKALATLQADKSFRITELVGYRCGQTRGRIVAGLRTEFSNHSFGTAIDLNSRTNGLYRRCDLKGKVPTKAKDIARCKKGIGGEWNPEKNRKVTITPTSKPYELLTTTVGWKWGGEIPGRTKDFMHFSVNGL